jgi:hypothetical protein
VETDQIDVFPPAVLGNLKKIQHAEKPGGDGQRGSDIRKTYRLNRIDLDLALVVHRVATADFDVRTQPEPDATGNFPAADSVAQSFREDHGESLRFSQIRHRFCVTLFGSQEAFHTMVLSKEELVSALQNEVRILVHLASKVDSKMLDYRPTPKQRSTKELLQYLVVMGPMIVRAVKAGAFDGEAWGAASAEANAMNFDQIVGAIQKQSTTYPELLAGYSDADFRGEIDLFGSGKQSRGAVLVFLVLGGLAAYRTQLFLYLKANGREELNTMNLWGGVDAPMPAM